MKLFWMKRVNVQPGACVAELYGYRSSHERDADVEIGGGVFEAVPDQLGYVEWHELQAARAELDEWRTGKRRIFWRVYWLELDEAEENEVRTYKEFLSVREARAFVRDAKSEAEDDLSDILRFVRVTVRPKARAK